MPIGPGIHGEDDSGHARGEVTRILTTGGDAPPSETGRLLELVYNHLRRLAQAKMADERAGHTLQATALVHEAFARLVGDGENVHWSSRGHFYGAAGEAMRRILVDHARTKGRIKRGGDERGRPVAMVPLNVVDLAAAENDSEILSVDAAFCRLEEIDSDLAKVVRLRFFAGLSEVDTAKALGVSDRTVRRDWTLAKAWLRRHLEREQGG